VRASMVGLVALLVIVPVASLRAALSTWRAIAPIEAATIRGGHGSNCCTQKIVTCSAPSNNCETGTEDNGNCCLNQTTGVYQCCGRGCQVFVYKTQCSYCSACTGVPSGVWCLCSNVQNCTVKYRCSKTCKASCCLTIECWKGFCAFCFGNPVTAYKLSTEKCP
jgi:hypothetical protein